MPTALSLRPKYVPCSSTNTTAIPTRPTTSDHGLKREPSSIGIHNVCGKGSVPLIEPTPGRFHGPKIRYRVIEAATAKARKVQSHLIRLRQGTPGT